MSGPHPRAVATLGPAAWAWGEGRRLHPRSSRGTRWWQRLALCRALEVDRRGELVWRTVVISGPRQVGKSWLERIGCGYRITHPGKFGGDGQGVLHVAHKTIAAKEVWWPAARYFDALPPEEASVRYSNEQPQIELADGSRWMIQAATEGAGVAFALAMALVDEGWRIDRGVYEHAIQPTMAEAFSPQTWLVSTAGTSESDLMMTYRSAAIAQIARPRDTLILEWSVPTDEELKAGGLPPADLDDPELWRSAQPHWDPRRRAAVRYARDNVDERAFRQQWLNQWVPSLTPPALGLAAWPSLATAGAPAGRPAFGAAELPDRSRAAVVALGRGVLELVAVLEPAAGLGAALVMLAERHAGVVGVDATGAAGDAAAACRKALGRRALALPPGQAAAAAGALFDALSTDPPGLRLRPDEGGELQGAVEGARKRRSGGTWAWDRDWRGTVMAACSAAAWADLYAADPEPEPEEPMIVV